MHGGWRFPVATLLMLISGERRTVGGRLIKHGFQALGGFEAQDVNVDGQAADRVEEQGKRGAALENKIQALAAETADQFQRKDVFLQRAKVARP